MLLRARNCVFTFPRPALVMGIVNVTPDSFSDGGRFLAPDTAVAHALGLAAQGADLLDIGGESTRPGAAPVSESAELDRVLPVLSALAGQVTVPLSIDTRKPAVARAALEAGASFVNDTGAASASEAMLRLIAETGAGYVAMHSQGAPATMQHAPHYADVVAAVDQFFGAVLERLSRAGVAPEQVVLDVGLGFGKNLEHNLQLLARLSCYKKWGRPLLVGASRKSLIQHLLGTPLPERLPASLACVCWTVGAGAHLLRTHDVAATVQAVRMFEAIVAHQH